MTAHLDALRIGLSREKARLANAKSRQERELRTVWAAQIEREIEQELKFLGITEEPLPEMSDDELLAALK